MNGGEPGPELWLVRHGETEWSRALKHTGRTDLPLTAGGEQAARRLAPRLAEVDFDLVMCSPLRRARHTAGLAGFPDAAVVEDAAEWDYGEAEGAHDRGDPRDPSRMVGVAGRRARGRGRGGGGRRAATG